MAERMAGSLVGATLTQIRAEKRNLRFVALDGVMPTLEAYLDGSYPHGQAAHLIAPATPSAEATAFVDFLAGPASPFAAARPWAGRWCPVTGSRTRLRALVTWLGLSVALAFTLIVPAGYFAIAYAKLNDELSFSANLKANRLAKYIYVNQQLWQYQSPRLSQLIEVPEADEREMRQRIFDAEGKPGVRGRRRARSAGRHRSRAAGRFRNDGRLDRDRRQHARADDGDRPGRPVERPARGCWPSSSCVWCCSGSSTARLPNSRPCRRAIAGCSTPARSSPSSSTVETLRLLDANEAAVRHDGWSRRGAAGDEPPTTSTARGPAAIIAVRTFRGARLRTTAGIARRTARSSMSSRPCIRSNIAAGRRCW